MHPSASTSLGAQVTYIDGTTNAGAVAYCYTDEVLTVENRGQEFILVWTYVQTGLPAQNANTVDLVSPSENLRSCTLVKGQVEEGRSEGLYCTAGRSVCVQEGQEQHNPTTMLLNPQGFVYTDSGNSQTTYLFSERTR